MAKRRHCKILMRGVEAWNEWRAANPDAFPDLSDENISDYHRKSQVLTRDSINQLPQHGTGLAGVNFDHAELSGADLSYADLSGADLQGAHLSGANLGASDLSNSSLRYAQLIDANLSRANLRGADLSQADLIMTNLSGADLRGARLVKAVFLRTVIAGVDLSEVTGLETVEHRGPSEISISTVYRSGGNMPEVFLRGCGVPDEFIAQIRALVAAMQPLQFYSCFISYSSKNEELAQRLYADLQSKGVRCWFAPEDMKIGDRFRRRIDEVIRVHDKLLLILSEHSVASSWVEKEVETAMESEDERKRTILFPVRLDDSVMEIKEGWPADVRRTRHVGDFRRWKEHDEYQRAFARLLSDLKASA